jgi:hypothetical protein
MKAKRKAEILMKTSMPLGNIYCAKRHCLWLVDEIIKELDNWKGGENQEWDIKRYKFWEDVKLEIQNYESNHI